jgi:predicted alpha/beta hydrolase family esterase
MLLPEPETAKWEEKILDKELRTIKGHIELAILVADSLGKVGILESLKRLKQCADDIRI